MACQAQILLQSTSGQRWVTIDDAFFVKYRTTIIHNDEVITAIRVPLLSEVTKGAQI